MAEKVTAERFLSHSEANLDSFTQCISVQTCKITWTRNSIQQRSRCSHGANSWCKKNHSNCVVRFSFCCYFFFACIFNITGCQLTIHKLKKKKLRQKQLFRWCQHNTARPAVGIAFTVHKWYLKNWTDSTMQSKVSLYIYNESLPCSY